MVSKYINFRPQLVFAEQSAGSAVVLTTEQKLSLYKKSQKSGISTDVLEEVYQRGYTTWNESFGQTAEQFAFDRVNSFIAGGFAAELDEDLMNEEKKGLWANIHAKRKRIESGSGERMRKPGSEGAPTNAALKASQTNEDKDPCWDNYKQVGMKKKGGKQVPNCVPEETAEKQSKNPNEPSSRFMGTTSLTNIYKEATPGQMKESTLTTIKRVINEAEYKIKSGDTLSTVAKRYGKTVRDLATINDIKDVNKLAVGQRIRLKAAEAPKPEAPATAKKDYTLGSSPRTGFRTSDGSLKPEVTKKPQGQDYTLGSQRTLQRPEQPKQPGVTVADPNKDLGDQIRSWMQPQVDRMIAARQQRSQTPATPRAPAVPSPKPLTKTQEAERDAEEKNTAEKAAADQAVYRGNVDTGQRGMPLPKGISDFLKDITPKPVAPRTQRDIDAATVRNSPPGSTVGSRYGAEGPDDDDSEAAKKTLKTIREATHQGRKVTLNKPFRTPGGPKKSAVYVDPDGDGKAKIVRFGDPKLSIKKDQPGRKKSYCARSGGQGNLTKKDSANYWSRKAWDC